MDIFKGRITSSSFSSGERIVIGDWVDSPLGSFTNIMWARADGKRILISPSPECASYVSNLYSFEEVIISPLNVKRKKKNIEIESKNLSIFIEWGWSFPIPFNRPRWFISNFEYFFANLFFGTKTHGKTKDNRKEWYMVRSISRVRHASAKYKGKSFGSIAKISSPINFGFSDPPKNPSSVRVTSMIEKN